MPFRLAERSAAHWALRVLGAATVLWLVTYPPRNFEIFRINQVTDALVFSLAALSLNLLIGYTGQISLGHSAFFGVGTRRASSSSTTVGAPGGPSWPGP